MDLNTLSCVGKAKKSAREREMAREREIERMRERKKRKKEGEREGGESEREKTASAGVWNFGSFVSTIVPSYSVLTSDRLWSEKMKVRMYYVDASRICTM